MLLLILRKIVATKYGHIALDIILSLGVLGLGYGVYKMLNRPADITVVETRPGVKTMYVDLPAVDMKLVKRVFSNPKDKKEIQHLLDENKKLGAQVVQLNNTVAELRVHGDGPVTVTPATATTAATTNFEDFRLKFKTDGLTAQYDLNQKFQVMSTTGRDKEGKRISLVNVFELGPNGEKWPLSDIQTTAIFADETKRHWLVSAAIQAGFAVTQDPQGHRVSGGLIGLQWLKQGRTSAAEDVRLAALTPVAFLSDGVREVGVLPISFNLGAVRFSPFKDLWVSPFVGMNWQTRQLSRAGIGLTATF